MEKILVIGGSGQLGQCIKKLDNRFKQFEFLFPDSSELDLRDEGSIEDYFYDERPQFCINAAAYTQVDKAEDDRERAFEVNAYGVERLATVCAEYHTVFIHISTDYVFDGNTNLPYEEEDWTNPNGVYGKSKQMGEELALDANPKTIVLRTSWLYSEFGSNFVKTMLRLFATKKEVRVVEDQFGQPTNANDLAEVIMKIVTTPLRKYGIFHFSNEGETNWFEFAKEIAALSRARILLNPIETKDYPTAAKRPVRSTLCLDKIKNDYGVCPRDWKDSLEEVIERINGL